MRKKSIPFFQNKRSKRDALPYAMPRNRAERRARPKELKKAEKQQKKFQQRQYVQSILKANKKKNKPKPQKNTLVDHLNKMLKHASNIYDKGSTDYSNIVQALMTELAGPQKLEAGKDYGNFKISKNYTGKPREVFKYVTFKNLPDDASTLAWVSRIESEPASTEEGWQKEQADRSARAVKTLIANRNKITLTKDLQRTLEQIMSSSAAWSIAKRGTYDSEQTYEAWSTMYDQMLEVMAQSGGDPTFIDEIITMIENDERFQNIVRRTDEILYWIMKGE